MQKRGLLSDELLNFVDERKKKSMNSIKTHTKTTHTSETLAAVERERERE